MKNLHHILFFCSLLMMPFAALNAVAKTNFGGPNSVDNTIAAQAAIKKSWREGLANQGLTFGADYFALGVMSHDGSAGNDVDRSSGIARFYGKWNLIGETSGNIGGIVWKVEQRHAYSETAPKNLAFIDDVTGGPEGLGYVGIIAPAYNDQGFRVTNLHWTQKFNGEKTSLIIGWQDVTDYVDAYALASPWSGFTNLTFSTGSGVMGLPDDGILTLSAGHMLTDNVYVIAGIADAKGKSDDILDGFNTLFNDGKLFTTLELGWTASQEKIYTDNVHITLWNMDGGTRHNLSTVNLPDGSQAYSNEDGQGINFSWSAFVTPHIMPFIRGGFSEGDIALYDKSISAGLGYFGLGSSKNNLGVAVNWSDVNEGAFYVTDTQFTAELYYNMQLGEHFQVTPDIQYIKDPALSSESSAVVLGVRARAFF